MVDGTKMDYTLINNGKFEDKDGKIHQTHLNIWENCPKKCYFMINNYPTIKINTKHMELGSVIHKIIEEYYKNIGNNPTDKTIKDKANMIFQEIWNKNNIPYMSGIADRCIKRFIEIEIQWKRNNKQYKPTFVEKDIKTDTYAGTIDYYHEPSATIRDWKTSKWSEMNNAKYIQGSIYKELVTKGLGKPVKQIIFEMLNAGTSLVMPNIPDKWLENKYNEMKTKIEANMFIKKQSGLCNYCEYQLACESEQTLSLWETF